MAKREKRGREAPRRRVVVYDTTLRDGTQAEEISLQVEDKLDVARKLDELGVAFIEGGWPGSNPRDLEFFSRARDLSLSVSRLAAFGSTRRKGVRASDDRQLAALVRAAPVVTIFGKSWDLHVRRALKATLQENLDMIHDSVAWLAARAETVFFDAEHFYDGYRENPRYSLACLRAAAEGGAACLVLCDTNGGSLPAAVSAATAAARQAFPDSSFGAHMHNDSGCAVANSLAVVEAGGDHVQGTLNGWGERCGNANLCSVIPALELKMGLDAGIGPSRLARLTEVALSVSELANVAPNPHQPYVGRSSFAHKGGVHVSALRRDPRTYEQIDPALVGNRSRILLSDLAGRSSIVLKAREFGIRVREKSPAVDSVLARVKELENRGFLYESAEASFELLLKKELGRHRRFFTLVGFRVISDKRGWDEQPLSEATIMVEVDKEVEHTAAVGHGPVDAMNNALRKALVSFYPVLDEVRLLDYKVRILPEGKGTAAVTRVIIESGDRAGKWSTVGVSENILEASWQALVDGIEYKLLREEEAGRL
jgi:2-isopropylmalate synthase